LGGEIMVRKTRPGSLGYQMENALKQVFHPGRSRHRDKGYNLRSSVIYSISSMEALTANVYQFSRFIKRNWPEVTRLEQVTPEMAQAYVEELVRRERSGGWIGRVCTAIRKLDSACRTAGIFAADAPSLLPYKDQGGLGGFHSQAEALAYTPERAKAIIRSIDQTDPQVARLLSLMLAAGLRVTEASYLRTQDIDLNSCQIELNQIDNANRTKGGRPRVVKVDPGQRGLLVQLKQFGEKNPSGHIFNDRSSLPDRARQQVRKACRELGIACLGTHGFRKTFAVNEYHHRRAAGASDPEALLATSNQLGHNRATVTRQSYVSREEREK
jgi:integrase